MMTLVVGESLRSRSATSMLHVMGSASTHLMRRRLCRMGKFVAVQVNGQVSTSSTFSVMPGQSASGSGFSRRCSARCSADVPELSESTRGCRRERKRPSSEQSGKSHRGRHTSLRQPTPPGSASTSRHVERGAL